MSAKVISAALFAAICTAAPALADLRSPAEMPPASYKGQQYVDSRGCVFLRAGYGGQVSWVPRVSRDRKQICGAPPSGRKVAVAVEAPAAAVPVAVPAPPPVKVAAAAPAPALAPPAPPTAARPAPVKTAPAAVAIPSKPAPVKSATPGAASVVAAAGTAAARAVSCPAETPNARRFSTSDGGSVVLCVKAGGGLEGAQVAAGSAAAPLHVAGSSPAALPLTPPPGYKLAWEDDRLNPNRGKQTVQGVLDQDRIWTRHVPAELRADSDKPARPLKIIVRKSDGSSSAREGVVVGTKSDGRRVIQLTDGLEKSTKSSPAGAGQRLMVQVGSFGVPANAEGAAGRLRALGLPVARGTAGKLQVVLAGPFATQAEASAALSAARKNGFGDAILLR